MDDILEILMQDARRTPAEIAVMTGRSEKDVKKAIKDYERTARSCATRPC